MTRVANDAATAASGIDPKTGKKKPTDLKDLDPSQFLQLMISELTNQDPLNPMDNTQLVEQIGHLRQISATDQLTATLTSVLSGQSLDTASGLIGKHITAIDDTGNNVEGLVDRVSIEVDEDDSTKRTYRVNIGDKSVDLKNVREVKP
jgi:flagellar basal-body rod modification protein FlgD